MGIVNSIKNNCVCSPEAANEKIPTVRGIVRRTELFEGLRVSMKCVELGLRLGLIFRKYNQKENKS